MNKSAKSVLILSIAANVILFAGLAAGYVSIQKPSASPDAARPAGGSALSPEAAKEATALFTTDDMTALRDGLRALGLPEDDVRRIVSGRISSRYSARVREINNAALEAARERPYWRGKRNTYSYDSSNYTPEQRKEMKEINDAETKEMRQLFGVGGIYYYGGAQYAFLSPEKTAQLREMERDYSDLRGQTIDEMAGFRMPDDEAKLKLLADENKRDRLALLTPEEKEADDLRNSYTAQMLRWRLAGSDMTEEEYKAIYALQSGLDEKYPRDMASYMSYFGGANMTELNQARAEEQKNIDAQIKDMLGDERYADYVRGQREDYQTLQAAAQRFNLSADTVAQTYQVRDDAANAAKQISDDTSLSVAQRTEAYTALAAQATAQIKASLGDEVGDAYINNALPWLKNLPNASKVTIHAKGNVGVIQTNAARAARRQGGK